MSFSLPAQGHSTIVSETLPPQPKAIRNVCYLWETLVTNLLRNENEKV